ncbi:hypothetical protein [Microvirga tunisiensis]|uniref:Uncharacterized protein n=1 Tax=Microvirga tunisiensis TaxID=2108360 RepID=A0A5N7MRZ0_9HYPH|nr:hypothetical protein [Microvirga tunisiensis]MPR11779.1 hypothetical protein [Microvirga tunisiensis]MPR29757.1 hypothetical protein [Microvirga tunisiensis]
MAAQQPMAKIPAYEAAKMMKVSTELQAKEATMAPRVQQLVDALNKQVDSLGGPMIQWAIQPLKTAQPKLGS